MKKYLMTMDQGTTSSRCIIYDDSGNIVCTAQKEHPQIYPHPGWVEHDPMAILKTQLETAEEVLDILGDEKSLIRAIGITNQRETTVVWDKKTGEPVYNAIVWQCRRTSEYVDSLKGGEFEDKVKEKTGLPLDAYFSATKVKWILDNVPGVKERAEKGEILFGTIDTWLIWNLTGGKVHATDYTNASRTMMFNIRELKWDEEILEALDIPRSILPEVRDSSGFFGNAEALDGSIPIMGVCGDQQSALFGQACFEEGDIKNTYGTGCFMLMNTGKRPVASKHGLITTVAWGINGEITYALEGSVFVAGAVIQWLRDELGLIKTAAESEKLAMEVDDTDGVYVVPAFTGLGAPYWDQYARGAVLGLTRGSGKGHIARACIESMAYQTNDLVEAMIGDLGTSLKSLRVDGGACNNNLLMQFQADISQCRVFRPEIIETTSLGAAYLAGLAAGVWTSQDDIKKMIKPDKVFIATMEEEKRTELTEGWRKAVSSVLGWSK